jgi:hypothetical protein
MGRLLCALALACALPAAASAAQLPATGVAVQNGTNVDLIRLDGHVVRTLPRTKVLQLFGVPVGTAYLFRGGVVWRIHRGRLERIARVLPRYTEGCFVTAPKTRICGYPNGTGPSRIVVEGRVVPGTRRAHGHWLMVDVSPRGRILAQWTGECEIPAAYIGSSAGVRSVASPLIESFALGWAGERAVVAFPTAACGAAFGRPGVYVGTRWIHDLRFGEVAALWR